MTLAQMELQLAEITRAVASLTSTLQEAKRSQPEMTRAEALNVVRSRWGGNGFIERGRDGVHHFCGYYEDDGLSIRKRFICGQGNSARAALDDATTKARRGDEMPI